MNRRTRLPLRQMVVLGAAAAVLVALLWPHHVDGAITWLASGPELGAAGGAGGIVWWALEDLGNIALFAPLGFALAWWSRRPLFALLAGATVSLVCEAAQHWIPTRVPSLQDVLWNVLGTLAGVALAFALGRSRAAASLSFDEELRRLEQSTPKLGADA